MDDKDHPHAVFNSFSCYGSDSSMDDKDFSLFWLPPTSPLSSDSSMDDKDSNMHIHVINNNQVQIPLWTIRTTKTGHGGDRQAEVQIPLWTMRQLQNF